MFRSYRDVAIPRNLAKCEQPQQSWYKCNFCDLQWDSETEVDIHKGQEHGSKMKSMMDKAHIQPVCPYCVTKHSKKSIQKHINTVHFLTSESAIRIEREIYICHHCSQLFFNKLMLLVHIAYIHKFAKPKSYHKCPKCFRMIHINNIWCHFRYHEVQSVSCCPICFEKCKDRAEMIDHSRAHMKYLYCNMCGNTSNDVKSFYHHVEKHENMEVNVEGAERYVDRLFIPSQRKSQWRYQRIKGVRGLDLTIGKSRICVLCRHICTGRASMIRHAARHREYMSRDKSEKILYTCACGDEFSNKILLKQHVFKLKGDHRAIEASSATTNLTLEHNEVDSNAKDEHAEDSA